MSYRMFGKLKMIGIAICLSTLFIGVSLADPTLPDCDGTKVAPDPGGLCGSATPCPTIFDKEICGEIGTSTVNTCVSREFNLSGCVGGGTSSQRCQTVPMICTATFFCEWTIPPEGAEYCACGPTKLIGQNGQPVISTQQAGFFVSCKDKTPGGD